MEEPSVRNLDEYCDRVCVSQSRPGALVAALRMAASIARRRAFHQNLLASRAAAQTLADWTDGRSFDVVIAGQLPMYRYVQPLWRRAAVLDSHNHEAARIRGIAEARGSLPRRIAARLQMVPVERYERDVVLQVALTLAVSAAECQAFERVAPGRVRLVPNGVDLERIPHVGGPPSSADILFVGSLDYTANADGVDTFMREVAPRVGTPDARFLIVGSNPPAWLRSAAGRSALNTQVLGFVDDLEPLMRGSRVLVVPLLRGGGTRLKILEALAWGIPVVTTTAGCAGLDLTAGEHALVEDEPGPFAAAIDRLIQDDALWSNLSGRGRALVEDRYGWQAVGDQLDAALREAIPLSPAAPMMD